MLINSLTSKRYSLSTPEEVRQSLSLPLSDTELMLIINALSTQNDYAENFHRIVNSPAQNLTDGMLALLSNTLQKAHRRYSRATTPSYAELLTEFLTHPNSGPKTLRTYHEACNRAVQGSLDNRFKKTTDNALLYLIQEDKLPEEAEQLTTQTYSTAGVIGHIALAHIRHGNPAKAETAISKAFEELTTRKIPQDGEAILKARAFTENEALSLDRNLKLLLDHIARDSESYDRTTQPALIKTKTLVAALTRMSEYSFPMGSKPEEVTLNQITARVHIYDPKHKALLSNASELPEEYQDELIRIQVEEVLQRECFDRVKPANKL